ncbi:MAG: serine--tRNA ligase [Candidatus Neomarinimicrobiota bacterium]
MLPLKFIRQNEDLVRQGLRDRGMSGDVLAQVLALDEELREQLVQAEELKARRNRESEAIARAKRAGGAAEDSMAAMAQLAPRIKELDNGIRELRQKLDERLLWLPNLAHASAPVGAGDHENRVGDTVGEPVEHPFEARHHEDLLDQLGLVDFEAGARIAGRGFPVYTGQGARLERALINFMLDLHTRERGYEEIFPPFLATRAATQVTGQLPKLEEDMYVTTTDDLFLIPTAEVPLTSLQLGQVLAEADLPLRYVAYSACFRREAGSYGKETRGLLRVHQFNKVELVKFVHPDRSYEELESLRDDAEEVLRRLGLVYRVAELCTGALSFAAAKCYDLEVHAPASDKWLEVSSCSNFEAFQARRGNIRFRRADSGKLDHVHTLNGSGLATPRLLVALLESGQQPDGAVQLPDALVPYYGQAAIRPR